MYRENTAYGCMVFSDVRNILPEIPEIKKPWRFRSFGLRRNIIQTKCIKSSCLKPLGELVISEELPLDIF